MSSLIRSASLPLATLLVLLASPAERAEAQATHVRLRVIAGALDPSTGLSYAPILASPGNAVSYDRLPTLAAAGLGIDVRPSGLPVLLRLSALRGLAREETGVWGCADTDGSPLPCPSVLILVPTEIGSTQVAADIVLEAPLGLLTLRPLVGGAWSRADYEWDPTPAGSFSLDTGSFTDGAWAFRYGIGVSLPVDPVAVEIERIWHRTEGDRRQTDRAAITSVAVSIPIRW